MSSLPKNFLSGLNNSDILDHPRRPLKITEHPQKRSRKEEPTQVTAKNDPSHNAPAKDGVPDNDYFDYLSFKTKEKPPTSSSAT